MVGSYAIDTGLIPGSSNFRQKSVVGQEIANLQISDFLKLEIFNPILKFTELTASFRRFGVLAKAVQWQINHQHSHLVSDSH